ncbi:hypothetical protein GXW82_19955 [Streptacidiphilus sp. 4-A2]|nr:hypothetical protein [Streptacidiphilus sp. 4-A2]
MDDEAFEAWARRREERRSHREGRLRLDPLTPGQRRGSHVDPDAPRLISRWDGFAWEPVGVAGDWAQATALPHPDETGEEAEARRPERVDPAPGTGPAERRRTRIRQLVAGPCYRPARPGAQVGSQLTWPASST